jgi:hypothetical protein
MWMTISSVFSEKEGRRKIHHRRDLVEKKFGSVRYICIAFSVQDNFSDMKYKVILEANFRAKKDLVITNATSYNAGLAFPAFRAATSSDGSYTQDQSTRRKPLITTRSARETR